MTWRSFSWLRRKGLAFSMRIQSSSLLRISLHTQDGRVQGDPIRGSESVRSTQQVAQNFVLHFVWESEKSGLLPFSPCFSHPTNMLRLHRHQYEPHRWISKHLFNQDVWHVRGNDLKSGKIALSQSFRDIQPSFHAFVAWYSQIGAGHMVAETVCRWSVGYCGE